MSADQYPTGTVARVRVGEWEGRAMRVKRMGSRMGSPGNFWATDGTLGRFVARDAETTVLDVELPAPVEERKAFGARVEAEAGGIREKWVKCNDLAGSWVSESHRWRLWPDFTNPVILHDPEATA